MYHGALSLDDLPRWWDTIDVNLSAPFRLARAAVDQLRRNEGQIINLASTLSVTGEAGFSAYVPARAGLLGLTKALARELAPKVRVNAVAPGDTDTPQQAVDAQKAGLTRAELYQRHARTTPIGRILESAEVARLIRYLAQRDWLHRFLYSPQWREGDDLTMLRTVALPASTSKLAGNHAHILLLGHPCF